MSRPHEARSRVGGCQWCRAYGPPRVSLAACIPAYPAGNADGRSQQAHADLPLAPLPPGRHGLALPHPAATAPATSTTATGRRRSRRPRCIRRSSLRSSPAFTRTPLRIPPASPWEIRDGLLSEPLPFPTALAVRRCRRLAPRPQRLAHSASRNTLAYDPGGSQPAASPAGRRPARLAMPARARTPALRSLAAPAGLSLARWTLAALDGRAVSLDGSRPLGRPQGAKPARAGCRSRAPLDAPPRGPWTGPRQSGGAGKRRVQTPNQAPDTQVASRDTPSVI